MIEPLEARIAPAKLLTFIDVDGDLISITTTKGTDAQLAVMVGFSTPAGAVPGGVAIDLTDLAANPAAFDGTSISVTAKRGPLGGDGLVNVGAINAAGLDLGTVTVKGDLRELDAGKSSAASKVAAINIHSATGSGVWNLNCSVGSLTVKNNVSGTEIVLGVTGATLGKLSIGGSLLGDGGIAKSGFIHVDSGTIGKVAIGGSIVGSFQTESGQLVAKSIGSVTVGGSLIGGASDSGQIRATDTAGILGTVTIKGDVRGGGDFSGRIESLGTLGTATIGGSVLGGSGVFSGSVLGSKGIGKVKIGHDLAGGSDGSTGRVMSVNGGIGGVTIGGSVLGGTANQSGRIFAGANLGPVSIAGDLRGGGGQDSGRIEAGGTLGLVTIGGSVLGGDGVAESGAIQATGKIAGVKIGGSLVGGGDAGGLLLTGGTTASFTTAGDRILFNDGLTGGLKIAGDIAGIIAKNVKITGNVGVGMIIGGALTDAGGVMQQSIGAVRLLATVLGNLHLQDAARNETVGTFTP